jgi:hypothetical protein
MAPSLQSSNKGLLSVAINHLALTYHPGPSAPSRPPRSRTRSSGSRQRCAETASGSSGAREPSPIIGDRQTFAPNAGTEAHRMLEPRPSRLLTQQRLIRRSESTKVSHNVPLTGAPAA